LSQRQIGHTYHKNDQQRRQQDLLQTEAMRTGVMHGEFLFQINADKLVG
jgi:hypothetical protein